MDQILDTPGMVRRAADNTSQPRIPPRPWWISPIFPLMLVTAGIVLLSLDGLHPYRTFQRKRSWKPVQGQLVQPYQRRQVSNPTAERSTVREYLERRPQKRIFQETISEGWPMERKKVQWRIRLSYTYPWGNARYTRMADGPDRAFPTEQAANEFLDRRLRGALLTVWVNPKAPQEATAFLEYRRVWIVRAGLLGLALGLIWLVSALVLGRSHAQRERALADAQSEDSEKKS